MMQIHKKEEDLVFSNMFYLYHKYYIIYKNKREFKTDQKLIIYLKYTIRKYVLPSKYILMIKLIQLI